ncbi:hypothetical protein ACLB2K_028555 [Fragaria x ananassa]
MVKSMLSSMEDGDISISAYNTAWVALVEDVNGNGSPQFPSSLEWIANNQLEDGSWGLGATRTSSLLAVDSSALSRMKFFKENLHKIEDENKEHILIGFDVAFPSLLEIARSLNLEVPDDGTPVLHEIHARRHR